MQFDAIGGRFSLSKHVILIHETNACNIHAHATSMRMQHISINVLALQCDQLLNACNILASNKSISVWLKLLILFESKT